jgi:Protein ChrB, N-terminal
MARAEWVLLAYRLPREPSTPRITLWRKLRRLGALQLVDGLVALPSDPRTVEAFDWLADEVVEAGGDAWTWRGHPGSKGQEDALRVRMRSAVAAEYRALTREAKAALVEPTRRTAERLRRELHRVENRDHVAPRERDQARRAVERLVAAVYAADAKEAVR